MLLYFLLQVYKERFTYYCCCCCCCCRALRRTWWTMLHLWLEMWNMFWTEFQQLFVVPSFQVSFLEDTAFL